MKEIKFRAWEKSLKEIIPVHTINFEDRMINTTSAWRFFDEVELMQFIGLQDRNGKDIYEGDIVRIGYTRDNYIFDDIGYVYYAKDKAMFYVAKLGEEQFNIGAITKNTINGKNKIFEIIGNIFETPELLSQEE